MPDVTKAHGRHVVVLAHPDPTSFNAAVAQAYCDTVRECGQEAILRDLYAMNFDPVLRNDERPDRQQFQIAPDVRAELEAIDGCDVVAFIYPIWFGLPPAMMKGYVDRVIGAGVSPQQVQDRAGQGPLTAGHMISITTSGARDAWLDEQGQMESLRELSSRYLFRAFSMRSAHYLHIGAIVEGLAERFGDQHLSDVREKARKICAAVATERYGAAAPPTIFDGS
ncbi:NAD(P)H dehydrogenase (quinone) [Sphingomonas sp. BE270]|jgi:NAD(P)H dehydrogenase (quinone)|uniref:NAD(P)H-dependent oxidoreductase n=2 Tax=Bacteria TaxID=2 RepID=UPI00286182E1|nr:NAD(P)H-dependent oxidoreductase [Sphingomonas sp. BE270]MDR7256423.1 NAD(P)H dehydrogenase (quinone) [Sphingomonas sp. BE270]